MGMIVLPWHARASEEVIASLISNAERGLSAADAKRRLVDGKNALPVQRPDGILIRIWRQLASPIAAVLLLAAVATLFISHYTDALVIALALFVNVAIGIFQEGKAGNAFAALAKEEAPRAVVMRDGAKAEIAAERLVPGDIVLLSAGSKVPADLRLLETHGLEIQEAALSGEWLAVSKDTEAVAEDAPLVERKAMAYAGTLVAAGAGKGKRVPIQSEPSFSLPPKLHQIPRLAFQRLANRLKRRQPNRLRLPILQDRQIRHRDPHLLRQLGHAHLPLRQHHVYVYYYCHGLILDG